jgi:hypothetical protein
MMATSPATPPMTLHAMTTGESPEESTISAELLRDALDEEFDEEPSLLEVALVASGALFVTPAPGVA